MNQVFNVIPLRLWLISISVMLIMIIMTVIFPSDVTRELAHLSGLFVFISTAFLLVYVIWKMTNNWLGLFVVTLSFLLFCLWHSSGILFAIGTIILGIKCLVHVLYNQVKGIDREVSFEEKKYWLWVNEFLDGRTSTFPKKPTPKNRF